LSSERLRLTHAVAQRADPIHLDLDDVARLQPDRRLALRTDPLGRARRDEIAGSQRGEAREIRDDLCDRENLVPRVGSLHLGAVHSSHQIQRLRVADLVERDEFRPPGGRSVDRLAREPLGAAILQVSGGDVVQHGKTCNIVERILGCDASSMPPDDDCEFAFEVEVLRQPRAGDLVFGADHRCRELREDVGVLGQRTPGFGNMIPVVQADAEHLRRVGDRGQEPHAIALTDTGPGELRRGGLQFRGERCEPVAVEFEKLAGRARRSEVPGSRPVPTPTHPRCAACG